jgi:hypothetical protein
MREEKFRKFNDKCFNSIKIKKYKSRFTGLNLNAHIQIVNSVTANLHWSKY